MLPIQWIGSILIIAGCGGIGQFMAYNYRQEEKLLQQLMGVLLHIQCELESRMSPLPVIFRQVGEKGNGRIHTFFKELASEMDRQISPDAICCVEAVLARTNRLPDRAEKCLRDFGGSLGEFDFDGQVRMLSVVRNRCAKELEMMNNQKEDQIRRYQTLGLCAGAAIAVLLL